MRRALLVNQRAGRGKFAARVVAAAAEAAPGTALYVTRSADELPAIAARLRREGVRVLGVAGGDGTLHGVLSALHGAYDGAPFPSLVPLSGGTVNSVSSSLDVDLRARDVALATLLAGREDRLREATRATVEVGGRLGSLTGVGVVPAYLAAYYATGDPTELTAAVVLAKTALAAFRGDEAAERLLARPRTAVRTDEGEDLGDPPTLAVVMGTVRYLGLRFAVFPRAEQHPDAFELVRVHGTPRALVGQLARIKRGRGIAPHVAAERITRGVVIERDTPTLDYMIDGELYQAQGGSLRVGLGPTVRYLRAP